MNAATALDVYREHARELGRKYDAVRSGDVLAPVAAFLPPPPARILDIGAGTGRDAVWLADRGYLVTAAEPTEEFRETIRGRERGIVVIDAALPRLDGIEGAFDLVLGNAVWHHVPSGGRNAALERIAALLAPGGRAVLSLRLGPAMPELGTFALDPDREIQRTEAAGFTLLHRAEAPSHQAGNIAAGVTWTWLVLEPEAT
ncbi:class I SAM-dependent methyltransferase [Ovoidimarina sediminis]|uniref:class I SAM-dependent methyltransferase n=1 Tax=Ovoidimarina sediminis TaxID=3079856 RepID=UPI00290E64E3|nr:class I SAM-dependent methyltransferase [Rhodophyticola sp. MJ-SS7]MDU8942449.1 class I SAM-dependent methyltransferase [Rhodophyticola sp. MJ-SS7]